MDVATSCEESTSVCSRKECPGKPIPKASAARFGALLTRNQYVANIEGRNVAYQGAEQPQVMVLFEECRKRERGGSDSRVYTLMGLTYPQYIPHLAHQTWYSVTIF